MSYLLENFIQYAEAKAQKNISDRKLKSFRKRLITSINNTFENHLLKILQAVKQKAKPNVNVYDMTLFALAQFAIIEVDLRSNENWTVAKYRLSQERVWNLLAQSSVLVREDEAFWFEQRVETLPDYIKMQFRSAFTASQMPKDQLSWISGSDIWKNLVATATGTLPLTAAQEVERAALANGQGTKDAIEAARQEVIEVNDITEKNPVSELGH